MNALVTSFKETILAECPGMIKRNETDSESPEKFLFLLYVYVVQCFAILVTDVLSHFSEFFCFYLEGTDEEIEPEQGESLGKVLQFVFDITPLRPPAGEKTSWAV